MEKLFETWKHEGIRFLAIPTGNLDRTVVDEYGTNYGTWTSIKVFKQGYDRDAATALGQVQLRVWAV